jgi:hypothetical protein
MNKSDGSARDKMRSEMSVQIPEGALSDFKVLLSTPVDRLDALAHCLANTSPLPDVEHLAEVLSECVGLPPNVIESILTILINLTGTRRNAGCLTAYLLTLVGEALAKVDSDDWVESDHQLWKERLPAMEALLLPDGALETMSKVREILFEAQSVFLKSSLLTDVRYVFDNNATVVRGALVLHTLALNYLESGEPRQVHLSLSTHEIEKLIELLQRSLKKEQVSQALLAKQEIPELTPRRILSS